MSNNKDFKVKNGIQPTVYHEGLGTVVSGVEGYYLAGASYDSVSFSVNAPAPSPRETMFNTDGTKMYVLDNGNDSVYQFSLSTGFDVSTASYDSVSFSVTSQASNPQGLAFNNNGTKMYVVGEDNDTVYQYTLSTGFDLSAASYDSVSFSVASQEATPSAVVFNNDGTKMYICGEISDAVHQYTLSTGFDLSTASYDSVSFDYSSQATTVLSMAFNNDGTKMFLSDAATDTIYQYGLSTAFNVSTASYDSVSFSVASQDANPHGIVFNATGDKLYVTGWSSDTIYQYSTALATAQLDLSTGSVFDYTPTSDVQVTLSNPAASGTVSGATLLLEGAEATGVANTFSTTLYTGNGAARDITNNIDLSTDGGMVWIKSRTSTTTAFIYDTERGATKSVTPSETGAQETDGNTLTAFNTDGFSVGTSGKVNSSSNNYVSWTFKKQSSFFDIVTYTGNGVAGREIAHNLGSTPAVIITKNLNDTENWQVYHKDLGNDQRILLNQDIASGSAPTHWNSTTPTDTVFTVGTHNGTNGSGDGIVAYLFAHDTDASSLIKCGSYTGTGSAGNAVTLGWEPQFIIIKSSTNIRNWIMFDSARGMTTGNDPYLMPNKSNGEGTTTDWLDATATGFELQAEDTVNASGDTFIYIAIRAENIPTITYDPTLEWSGGTAPTAPANGETDVVTFNTRDGGSTYQGVLAIDGAK